MASLIPAAVIKVGAHLRWVFWLTSLVGIIVWAVSVGKFQNSCDSSIDGTGSKTVREVLISTGQFLPAACGTFFSFQWWTLALQLLLLVIYAAVTTFHLPSPLAWSAPINALLGVSCVQLVVNTQTVYMIKAAFSPTGELLSDVNTFLAGAMLCVASNVLLMLLTIFTSAQSELPYSARDDRVDLKVAAV